MENIEAHIEKDKKILEDPTTSPQQRRHVEEELHDLEDWVEHHKEEIEAGIITIQVLWNFIVIKIHPHLNARFTITDYIDGNLSNTPIL